MRENLQDHPTAFLRWSSSVPPPPEEDPANLSDPGYDAAMGVIYRNNHTGPWTVSSGNIFGFFTPKHIQLPCSVISAGSAQSTGQYLRPDLHPTVIAGCEKMKAATLRLLKENKLAVVEAGFYRVATFDAIMHPLSRGFLQITTPDPFALPKVDWRALSNPFDWDVMISSIRWQQNTMSQAPALKVGVGAVPTNSDPTLTDAQLKATLRESMWPSLAHLSGTCPMLKREEGGVVDKYLKVYGVEGLRIVDASVPNCAGGALAGDSVCGGGEGSGYY